jgi:hypothetical protein
MTVPKSNEAFDRFRDLAKRIVSVPKAEVDARAKAAEKAKKRVPRLAT